ncbi:class F sortase [Actinomycetospora callitridis]|jgi:sortase (surface protein transpeptidase)|uniref:class F sortase n=1 Tax=Actinomycetospora callitridis TaxID=913944 RepID=UPI0023660985|nr:class F sortase [Actinomycetospora callitridis]MDD7916183.1 class F sortase [Actinomycetospora callitridis]
MSITDKGPEQKSGISMTNVSIGLIVVLVGLALVVGMNSSGPSGFGSPAPLAASAPTRVTVPSISAESSLVPTGLQENGSLEVPPVSEPMQASWFDQSPTPGEVGPSIVLGHVNGGGRPGIFVNLKDVVAGAQVFIDRADGQRAVFEVSRVDTIPKDSFPTDAVYNDTANPQLRLITCGGDYDRSARSYLSNVIVYADFVEVQKI